MSCLLPLRCGSDGRACAHPGCDFYGDRPGTPATAERSLPDPALVARLTGYEQALREIAEWDGFTADCCDCMEDVVGIARAALSGCARPDETGQGEELGGGRSASTSEGSESA